MAILCFVLAIICIVVYAQLSEKYDIEWINAFTIIFIAYEENSVSYWCRSVSGVGLQDVSWK